MSSFADEYNRQHGIGDEPVGATPPKKNYSDPKAIELEAFTELYAGQKDERLTYVRDLSFDNPRSEYWITVFSVQPGLGMCREKFGYEDGKLFGYDFNCNSLTSQHSAVTKRRGPSGNLRSADSVKS